MSNIPLPAETLEIATTVHKLPMPKFYFILFVASLLCSVSRADVNIVATIKPLEMIAQAVVQQHGSVTSIVDAQQSPHHFTVSPSDRIALSRADLALWIGPLFETHVSDFFAQSQVSAKTITVVDLPGLQLHSITENQLDAHLWLDSSNAVRIAYEIAERAADIDPANAATFHQNAEWFAASIEVNNQQIAKRFEQATKANYAVYHNAYQYFEQQFGLQHSLVILQDPEVQPGIRKIVQLRDEIGEQQPACLLLEFDSSMELVSTVLDGHEPRLITVDLLGSSVASGKEAYSEFVANLADDFYQCLYE